jgi:hypothetical protein
MSRAVLALALLMDEPDPALADFNCAIELAPNNAVFYLNRSAVGAPYRFETAVTKPAASESAPG